MGKKYLASVAEVELFEKVDGALRLFASAHTLTDSAMSFSNSMEEVRGGQGGKLYGRFGHTSGITLQMTDIIVNMNYFKALIGAELNSDGNITDMVDPISVTFSKHTATLTEDYPEPVAIGNLCGSGVVAWAYKSGCSGEGDIYPLSADVRKLTGPDDMPDGEYCVRYFVKKTSGTLARINAMFKPMELYARVSIPEFAADASAANSDGVVGHLVFNFPRYQFDGSFDLSLSMTANATIALNGTVLAVPAKDCTGKEYYGEIMEIPVETESPSADFRFGLRDIIIDPEYLKTTDAPNIWGIYVSGAKLLLNDKIAAQTALDGTFNGFKVAETGADVTLTGGKWTKAQGIQVVICDPTKNAPTGKLTKESTGVKILETATIVSGS